MRWYTSSPRPLKPNGGRRSRNLSTNFGDNRNVAKSPLSSDMNDIDEQRRNTGPSGDGSRDATAKRPPPTNAERTRSTRRNMAARRNTKIGPSGNPSAPLHSHFLAVVDLLLQSLHRPVRNIDRGHGQLTRPTVRKVVPPRRESRRRAALPTPRRAAANTQSWRNASRTFAS